MKIVTCCSVLALILAACASSEPIPTPQQAPTNANDLRKEVTDLKVTIVVTDSVARSLHGLIPATDESRELIRAAETLGIMLEPLHPGVDDPTLLPYFTANVPDMETADRVIKTLQQLPAVEGAYTKPPDEPP